MSRFAVLSVVVVLCAVQFASAEKNWEGNQVQEAENAEQEIPNVILGRVERSSKSRKPEAKKLRQLRRSTKVNSNPCDCSEKGTCSCCAKFSIDGRSTGEFCSTVEIPDGKTRNQFLRYNYTYNDQVVSSATAPGNRNPKGSCQPFNRFPGVTICSRFHSTQVENGKVRFCLTMEGKYQGFTFYTMDFDCVTYDVENETQVGN